MLIVAYTSEGEISPLFRSDKDAIFSACDRVHQITLEEWSTAYALGYAREFTKTGGNVGSIDEQNSGLEKQVRGAVLEIVLRNYLVRCGHQSIAREYDKIAFDEDYKKKPTAPDFWAHDDGESFWFDMKSARCVPYHRKVLATLEKLPETVGAFCVGFTEVGSSMAFLSRQCWVSPGAYESRCVGGMFQRQEDGQFAGAHSVDRDRFLNNYSRLSSQALGSIGHKKYTLEEIKAGMHSTFVQCALDVCLGLPAKYYAFD